MLNRVEYVDTRLLLSSDRSPQMADLGSWLWAEFLMLLDGSAFSVPRAGPRRYMEAVLRSTVALSTDIHSNFLVSPLWVLGYVITLVIGCPPGRW